MISVSLLILNLKQLDEGDVRRQHERLGFAVGPLSTPLPLVRLGRVILRVELFPLQHTAHHVAIVTVVEQELLLNNH